MPEIRFYHLTKSRIDDALPALLQKVIDMGIKSDVIISGDVNEFSTNLWESGSGNSFIANDTGDDITTQTPVAIYSNVGLNTESLRKTRFFVDEISTELMAGADLNCFMFNGNDERILTNARALWKDLADKDEFKLVYYHQNDNGVWETK